MTLTDDGIWILRFFGEFHDPVCFIGGQDAEFVGAFDGHVNHTHRNVGFALFVICNHRTIVHLINMVAGKNQHMGGVVGTDEFQILIHRVRGASIPIRADLLLSGNQFHELAEFAAQVAPAALNVLYERLSFVLSQDRDLPYPGIDAIREDEIDDPKFTAEWRCRLAAMLCQRLQALAATSCHDHRQCAACQSADIASGVGTSSVSHTVLMLSISIASQPTTWSAA